MMLKYKSLERNGKGQEEMKCVQSKFTKEFFLNLQEDKQKALKEK
jgi:hypothetical protein